MTRPFPWAGRVALAVLLPIGLWPFIAPTPLSLRPSPSRQVHIPTPRVHDWSARHVIYAQFGTARALEAARNDPRALFRWREVEQRASARPIDRSLLPNVFMRNRRPVNRRFPLRTPPTHTDWSVGLGNGTTSAGQTPAKFSFDTSAAADCINDFVVFPINANGSATQANIVAFNRLYSGTAGGSGICNRNGNTNGTDSKTDATVLWSYNVHSIAAGGAVPTSPVLSLDGAKVAFVESAPGNAARFHVLAWKSGDTNSTNLQTTGAPKEINTFVTTAPVAGTGTATDLQLGTATTGTDSMSSPFVDYVQDMAYVGNDSGVLFRIKDVFCTTPTCAGAPSIDSTWGSGGSVIVGSGSCAGTTKSMLTGAVLDFVTLNVYVGCANGKVYGFDSSGAALSYSPVTVGDGSANGVVVDPPIVDGVNGFVYAVSGWNGTNEVLVQAKTDLSSVRVATMGTTDAFNIHAPAVNDAYFTDPTPSNWLMYVGGFTTVGSGTTVTNLMLYAVTFDSSRNLTPGPVPASRSFNYGTRAGECSPLTEFLNGTDWLFVSIAVAPPDIDQFDINAFPSSVNAASNGNGTSGMVVDNSSTSRQASSFYFGTLGTNNAVKLTQAGLQ
jgi:hypothetical protein